MTQEKSNRWYKVIIIWHSKSLIIEQVEAMTLCVILSTFLCHSYDSQKHEIFMLRKWDSIDHTYSVTNKTTNHFNKYWSIHKVIKPTDLFVDWILLLNQQTVSQPVKLKPAEICDDRDTQTQTLHVMADRLIN